MSHSLHRGCHLPCLALTLLTLAAQEPAQAAPDCPARPAAAPAVTQLRSALAARRFVAYEPTALKVVDGRPTSADAASIRADLAALRPHFDALVTYDAVHGAQQIPQIAASLKYRALIIGVWDPFNEAQLAAALSAAQRFPQLVAGLSLGNELLFSHRSDTASLAALLAYVRKRAPRLPLSTSEPFHVYEQSDAAPLLAQMDFMLANVHPVFQPWFKGAPDSQSAQFVMNVVAQLAARACGPILVKETGVPSAPAAAGFTEGRQAGFYRELRRTLAPSPAHAFAYFAAFDAPWRAYDATGVPGQAPAVHEEEAHWGLYDAARRPKPAARELAPLRE